MSKFSKLKDTLACNKPRATPDHPTKKKVVKACENGKEKMVRYGAKGYEHNYSAKAKKSFRARHNCDSPGSKLGARYWACLDLWPKNKKGW